jgi:ferredoxin-NADP reductase
VLSSSTLAFVTTLHVALLLARRQRTRPSGVDSLLLAPAFLFAGFTWIIPDPIWIATGAVAHLSWFAFCEHRFPPASRLVAISGNPRAAMAAPLASPTLDPAAPRPVSREPQTLAVLAVLDETPDIKTFRIVRPSGFDFRPGQFLTLRVRVEGKTVQRAYSVSSAPHARGYLEFSVKRIGLVSGLLHSTVKPGTMLTVRPPAGPFTYPANDPRPLLLLAGGIGITPLISMLRHGVVQEPSRPITLLYSIRTPDDLAFRDDLAVIARRYPQVRLGITVSQGPASDRWHHGRITPSLVRAYLPDLSNVLTYVCGPQAMIDSMKALMNELGVAQAQVRSESFGAAMKLVTTEAASDEADEVRVRFARTGVEAHVPSTRTLLEAAEDSGVDIPSVCRAGSCHTCMTRVVTGDVCCESDTLSAHERAEGFILPCVSRARGNCVLEA